MTARPKAVRLRVYQVGFGDCLLLTVTYGSALDDRRTERHMLIDFGSREQRKGGPSMAEIGAKIAEHCGSRLDVLVATHRHQDHIKGFGDRLARRHVDDLRPKLVVRPWTDVPDADGTGGDLHLDEASREFISLLAGVHAQAEYVQQHFALDENAVARRAKELAALGIKNAPAVAALEDWAANGKPAWVKAGDYLDLEDLMPGVAVRVLAPPTLDEVRGLASYARESGEYWLRLAAAGGAPALRPKDTEPPHDAFTMLAEPGGVGSAAWLLRELRDQELLQALRIVEGFDHVLNNTSVVLLVTVGRRSMLLAGDAQVENWSLALDQALGEGGRPLDRGLRKQLATVDLYKVGHHGSRNATPRRLYRLWERRSGSQRPLVSVLTTLSGVYDRSDEGAVPKPELVRALAKLGAVHSTEDLPEDVWWFDLVAPTKSGGEFVHAAGPAIA